MIWKNVIETVKRPFKKVEGHFYWWLIEKLFDALTLGGGFIFIERSIGWMLSASWLRVAISLFTLWILFNIAIWIIRFVSERLHPRPGRIIVPSGYKPPIRFPKGTLRLCSYSAIILTFFGFVLLTARPHEPEIVSEASLKEKRLQAYMKTGPTNLHECFENDFNARFRTSTRLEVISHGEKQHIIVAACLDFDGLSMFLVYYIPPLTNTFEICKLIPKQTEHDLVLGEASGTSSWHSGDSRHLEAKDLKFSGRVFLYHEQPLRDSELETLTTIFKEARLDPVFRGWNYLDGVRQTKYIANQIEGKPSR